MSTRLPLVICLVSGVVMFLQYFSRHPAAKLVYQTVINDWWQVIFAFTLIVGVVGFTKISIKKISQKKDVLERLFKDTFREEVLNFLLLLLDKKRQTIILRVEREYKTLMNNFLNKSEVSVISAYKLDRGEVEHIKTSLSENLKRDIEILEAVDPSILGGLILRINNNIVDASIEGQLKRMEKRLLK